MNSKIKISIEIERGFTQANYDALKTMMDAYVGEFIKANPPIASPYAMNQSVMNSGDMNFVITFQKPEPTQVEY